MDATYTDIAKMFDHALLKPTMTDDEMRAGCRQCREYDVATVCIRPCFVAECRDILAGSRVLPGTVIGFPHGSHHTAAKLAEAEQAITDGAAEVDMVVNIGKVLSGEWDYVGREIRALTDLAHDSGRLLKIIFENCYLEDEHKIRLCGIAGEVGADFVKTSTGFGTGGATMADLKLMREYSPEAVQVKASGGVRTLDQVLELRGIGVTRIGTSNSFTILDDFRARERGDASTGQAGTSDY